MSRKRSGKARYEKRKGPALASFDSSWLRRVLVRVVALKLVGLILLFDPMGLEAFDVPKSVFSRATEWLLVAGLVLAFARYGAAILPRTKLHLAVVAYIAASVLAAVFAENRYLALYGEFGRYVGLTLLLDMAVLYVAVAVGFRRDADWLLLGGALGFALLGATAYAFAQRFGVDPARWVDDVSARPFSTFGNSNMFANFLVAAFGAALGTVLFVGGRHALAVRAAAACVGVLALADLALAATRGSVLGLGALVAGLPVIYLRARVSTSAGLRLALLESLVGVAVIALLFISPLGSRVVSTLQGVGLADRLTIYQSGIAAFLARPIFGYGPDNFAVAYAQHRLPESTLVLGGITLVTSAHSWLLNAAVTTGTLGLITLLALLGRSVMQGWSALRANSALAGPLLLAMLAYLATGLVSPNAVTVDWIPWLVVGGLAGLAPVGEAVARRGRRIYVLGGAALIVAIAGAISSLGLLTANSAGQVAMLAPDKDLALLAATSAIRLDPGRARYWSQLGFVYERRKQWREASDAYAEATVRAPHNASYWANLVSSRLRWAASLDQRTAVIAAAMAAAERAVQVDPNNPVGHVALAQVANAFGQYDLALREILTATQLYNRDSNYGLIAAEAAVRHSNPASARRDLEALLEIEETGELRFALARVALKLNDRASARFNLERVLAMDPSNREAKQLLSEMGN